MKNSVDGALFLILLSDFNTTVIGHCQPRGFPQILSGITPEVRLSRHGGTPSSSYPQIVPQLRDEVGPHAFSYYVFNLYPSFSPFFTTILFPMYAVKCYFYRPILRPRYFCFSESHALLMPFTEQSYHIAGFCY